MRYKNPRRYLEIEPEYYDYKKSRFVVIPCPHESTVSYGRGTKRGPAAILSASQEVEWFDLELGYESYRKGWVYTLKPVSIENLKSRVTNLLDDKKIPIILGGEHSITPVAISAFAKRYKNLSVLQLDAHADLRDSYEGSKGSHACAMRRTLEICPVVQVGIRSISVEEWEWAKKTGQLSKIHIPISRFPFPVTRILKQLSSQVYITIDVDVFDPSIMPSTGTPEPGGLTWHQVLEILKAIVKEKRVVGYDVVELAPHRGETAPDFMIAKLIYKIMGFITAK